MGFLIFCGIRLRCGFAMTKKYVVVLETPPVENHGSVSHHQSTNTQQEAQPGPECSALPSVGREAMKL